MIPSRRGLSRADGCLADLQESAAGWSDGRGSASIGKTSIGKTSIGKKRQD